jgi:signal transduction histidine kinase/streptogramin lyase/DNA-binding response OmpR family regulator
VPLSQYLRFGHLTTDDGLPEGRVWGITQDNRGFMWFTTLGGLTRYDGYEFKVYQQEPDNPNSPGGTAFWTVHEDRQGMIWAGSARGGGLSRFDPTTEQWTRFQHDPDDPHSLSSNNVWDIAEDSGGDLWIGTDEGGLNRFEGQTEDGQGRFARYQHDPDDPRGLGADFAIWIYEDRAGILWIGTSGGGLNRFDPQTEVFTRYRHDPEDLDSLSHDFVFPIYEDQSGDLWVGTYGGGLNRFDRETETFTRYQHDPEDPSSLSGNMIVDIREDQFDTLWIATFDGGLNRYRPESDSFTSYQHDPVDSRSLGSNTLASLFVDRSGILWIGSAGDGISKLDSRQQGFAVVRQDPTDANSLSENDVRAVYEDQSGDLWVGTAGGGLNRYDPETGRFTHYLHDPADPTSLSGNHVLSIEEDSAGVLWVGVDGQGLNRLDRETETFSHFEPDPADPHSLSDGLPLSLHVDRTGTLWIGTFSEGLDALDLQSPDGQARFTHYRHDPQDPRSLGKGMVYVILEDQAGVLWVGTAGGGLNRFDRETETFTRYQHDPEDAGSLSDNTVYAIHEDREGALWIGTSGGLDRLDLQTFTFLNYNTADGLANNTLCGILEDDHGHLWLSTVRGLSRFDPEARAFRTYTASDGLQGDVFHPTSYHRASTGELLFGGENGLTAFHPDDVQENPHIPPVYVTSLQLAHEPVAVGGDSLLQASILETEELVLSHDDRIVSFEFAALSFNSPDKNRYRYKLEGFEGEWREADSTRRLATYTNLDPGDYVFRVIGSNNDGVWNEEGASIAITVTPPWWETTWFRIGVLLLAIGLVLGGYRWRVRSIEARSRALEAQVQARTRQLQVANQAALEAQHAAEAANGAKTTFLANMSHELRTPLNAILGFSRMLARGPDISEQQGEMLDIINRNGEHLLGMVNDVLSLTRIEAGRVELHEEPFSVAETLKGIGLIAKSQAESKGLQFDLELDVGLPSRLQGDVGKLGQVLVNLLGNSFKYTAQGGVWLRARAQPVAGDAARVMLHLEVEDTGMGIPSDQLDQVFDAFVRGEGLADGQGGTGLGLTISRSLVEKMGGKITVESELGQGSLFRVAVPMQLAEAGAAASGEAPLPEVVGLQEGQPAWRILVVDDNPENSLLLTRLLEETGFTVQEAANGEQAMAAFEDWHPHLVWMDMRMPGMDGYEATRRIRSLPGGESIKIVAVTASVFEEEREEILASGCDGLVCKPFRDDEILDAMATQLGAKYRYREGIPETVPSQRIDLTAEVLAGVPPELLQELDRATLALDREASYEVIERIGEHDPEVADGLRALIRNYQSARIRALLEEAGTRNGS